MLFCKLFIDVSAAVWPPESAVSLLTAQRERLDCTERVIPSSKVFSKKVARLVSSMYLLWKKAAKRVCKLLNRVLKSRSCVCVRDAGADGRGGGICGGRCGCGPPQINQRVGNIYIYI